jgi:lipopolysaccharide export LptBFGC system permease protein LptF
MTNCLRIFFVKLSRRFSVVDRYLLWQYAVVHAATVAALFVLMSVFIFIVQANALILQRVGIAFIGTVIGVLLPEIAFWALFFAAFIAPLLTVNRLVRSNQLLALRLYGFTMREILRPFLLYSVVPCLLALLLANVFMPQTQSRLERALQQVAAGQAPLLLEARQTLAVGSTLVTVNQTAGDKLRGLIVIDYDEEGNRRVLTAESAYFDNGGRQKAQSLLSLDNVTALSAVADYRVYNYRIMHADAMRYSFNARPQLQTPLRSYRSAGEVISSLRARLKERRSDRLKQAGRQQELLLRLYSSYSAQNFSRADELYNQYQTARNFNDSSPRAVKEDLVSLHQLFILPLLTIVFTVMVVMLQFRGLAKYGDIGLVALVMAFGLYLQLLGFVNTTYLVRNWPLWSVLLPELMLPVSAVSIFIILRRVGR